MDLIARLEYAAKQCCNRQYAKLFTEAVEELKHLEELTDELSMERCECGSMESLNLSGID